MHASLDPHSVTTEPPGLYATLAARARRASDAMLATLAGIGLIATLLLVVERPRWGVFALPLIAVGAFGLWGIAERELTDGDAAGRVAKYRRAIVVAQRLVAALGTVAMLATAFAVLGLFLGTIIS
jgi:hypothetical protein